jgi:hypothetical protein
MVSAALYTLTVANPRGFFEEESAIFPVRVPCERAQIDRLISSKLRSIVFFMAVVYD